MVSLRSRNLGIASLVARPLLDPVVGEGDGILRVVVRIAPFEVENS